MVIDSAAFTPVNAALGGLMIGIAVAVLLLFNGRIADQRDFRQYVHKAERLADSVYCRTGRCTVGFTGCLPSAGCGDRRSYPLLIAAGLLVGFGHGWVTAVPADTVSAVWRGYQNGHLLPWRCLWSVLF